MLPTRPVVEDDERKLVRTRTQRAIDLRGAGPILFKKTSYERVERNVDFTLKKRLICDGDSRESIVVDIDSVKLNEIFQCYLAELINEETDTQPYGDEEFVPLPPKENPIDKRPHELLQHLMGFILRYLPSSVTEADITRLVNIYNNTHEKSTINKKDSFVPIDYFFEARTLICRHKALIMAAMLAKLINHLKKPASLESKDGKSSNQVYRFRTNLILMSDPAKVMGHAAVIMQAENGHRYLIDLTCKTPTLDGLVLDITELSKEVKEQLRECYQLYNGVLFAEEINRVYDELKHTPAIPKMRSPA